MRIISEKNLWGDGYIQLYDFSRANTSHNNRVEAVCEIAKVCRNIDVIKDPEKLYQKLLTEHAGGPSEIFSFIPFYQEKMYDEEHNCSVVGHNCYDRFCYETKDGIHLTNQRNFINNFEFCCSVKKPAKGFLVFKIKIPYMIVDHMRRHQMLNFSISENWRTNRIFHAPEYYLPNNPEYLKFVENYLGPTYNKVEYNKLISQLDYEDFIEIQKKSKFRKELFSKGEFGLRYTEGFIGGWIQDPATFKNLFSVRSGDAKGVQKETKELSDAMFEMIPETLRVRYL